MKRGSLVVPECQADILKRAIVIVVSGQANLGFLCIADQWLLGASVSRKHPLASNGSAVSASKYCIVPGYLTHLAGVPVWASCIRVRLSGAG